MTTAVATPTVDMIVAEAEKTINAPAVIPSTEGQELIVAPVDGEVQKDYDGLMKAFEGSDTNGILMYASEKQRASTAAAESLLDGVRNKDLGPVGTGLNNIALSIKGFDLSMLKGEQGEPGFFGKLMGKVSPVAKWLESYSTVEGQIDAIVKKLNEDQLKMMEDVEKLDRMFNAQVDHFRGLEAAIEAGDRAIAEINNNLLPKLQKKAEASTDAMAGAMFADKKDMRDKIERRIHDLRLTREIIRQNLPGIRTTQQSDAGLVEKIETIKVNTIPLWKQQMAILVAAARTKGVAQAVNEVTDVTNDLLRSGAELVKDANVEARRALERGIVSVETIEYANGQMIAMIEETQAIYEEAKTMRADAVGRLDAAAAALKQAQLVK